MKTGVAMSLLLAVGVWAQEATVDELLDAVPPQLLHSAGMITELLDGDELDQILEWGVGSERVQAMVALHVLRSTRHSEAADVPRKHLLASIRLGAFAHSAVMRSELWGQEAGWYADVREPALAYALKLHERETGQALSLRDDGVPPFEVVVRIDPHPAWSAAIRRCRDALCALDFDAARDALAELPDEAIAFSERREKQAAEVVELLCTIDRCERVLSSAGASSRGQQLARLQALSLCDGAAAATMAKELQQAGSAHPLVKAALLSMKDRGSDPDWRRRLEEILEAPEVPFYAVGLFVIDRMFASVRDAQRLGDQWPEEELKPVLQRLDALLEGKGSDEARYLRMHRGRGWPEPEQSKRAMGDLAFALEVAEAFPRMIAAQHLLVSCAVIVKDTDGAVEALSVPVSPLLQPDIALARSRASAATFVAMRADRPIGPLLEQEFERLQRLQRDPRDVHYLRGVLAWSQFRSAGDRADAVRAREHFEKAQRAPFEEGALPAFSALQVARANLGEELAGPREMQRAAQLAAVRGFDAHVPLVALRLLQAPRVGDVQSALRLVERLQGTSELVIRTALAHAFAALGHVKEARREAGSALQLMDDDTDAWIASLPLDGGVMAVRQYVWDLQVKQRTAWVQSSQMCELLVVPALPDRARLEQIRDGE